MNSVETWQNKISKDFPKGALVSWEKSGISYRVPRFRVAALKGFSPVVSFAVFDSEKGFTLTLDSYAEVQKSPLVIRVTLVNEPGAMLWSANIPDELASLMETA